MRAKKIYESIDFERGIDPKQSMGLGEEGLRHKWSSLQKGDIIRIKKPFGVDNENRISRKERVMREYTPSESLKVETAPQIHDDGCISFTAYKVAYNYTSHNDYFIWGTPWDFEEFFEKRTKIKESIDFERGKDPKDALRIGKDYIWDINSDELAKQIIDEVKDLCEPIMDNLLSAVKKAGYEDIEEYLEYSSEYLDTHNKSYIPSKNISDIEDTLEKTIANEIKKYPIKPGEEDGMFSDLFTLTLEGGPYLTYLDMIRRRLDTRYLKESFDFERGKDPKSSMGVGLKEKYGKMWDLFQTCYNLSTNSENFTYVSDIMIEREPYPYFIIESVFFYTDEDNNKIPESFVIKLYQDELECYNVITKDENTFRSEKRFIELTTCFDPDDNGGWMYEGIGFERGKDPKDAMEIGSPLARLADELGMTYAEIRQDKKDLQEIVAAAVDPSENQDKDYRFAFYAVADDPMAYDIPRGSRLFDVALWADGHQEEAVRILRTPDRVSESANFERGMNPKQAVGIGVLGRKGLSIVHGYVRKGSRRIASVVDIVQALSNYYRENKIDRAIFRFPANTEPLEFLATARPGEEMDWPEQGYRKISYEEIVTELILLAQNDPDFVRWIKPSVMNYEWENWQPLLEDVNFERGLDPKRAMGLGIVKVKGDRGYGDYMVRLIKPYKGDDAAPGEDVWEIEYADGEYAGYNTYAYKYPNSHILTLRGYWGEIDAFIKHKNESIDFKRGLEPKRALGIGKTFYNLNPGDILKPKMDMYVGPRTNFISGSYGTKIWNESYVVVIDSEETPGGKLKVYYYQTWELDQAEMVKDNIEIYARGNSMTGTEKQFKNRFEILQ